MEGIFVAGTPRVLPSQDLAVWRTVPVCWIFLTGTSRVLASESVAVQAVLMSRILGARTAGVLTSKLSTVCWTVLAEGVLVISPSEKLLFLFSSLATCFHIFLSSDLSNMSRNSRYSLLLNNLQQCFFLNRSHISVFYVPQRVLSWT